MREGLNVCSGGTDFVQDCAGGGVAGCFNSDVPVSASDVDAGTYTLIITGREGTTDCYRRTVNLTVSGGGLVTNLNTITLPFQGAVPGCLAP